MTINASNARPPDVEDLSYPQRERLAYLEFRLCFFGEASRPDLYARFGVAPAAATRDFALYRELAPANIVFHGSSKTYRIGADFSPIFEHDPKRVLSALAQGFGAGVDGASGPMLPCESPAMLSVPPLGVLAAICRAIHAGRPLAIRYHSMSSGMSRRVIVPFALVDTGLRWHARAFDRKSGEFRDFVLTRIESPQELDVDVSPGERAEADIQWTRVIELDLVPHPRVQRPEIIRMDYSMTSDVLRVRARAAVAGYMLLRWSVDCSPDHALEGEQYRLWLRDPLALYGASSATLAPGYTSPVPERDTLPKAVNRKG
ncbi:helix-turn-helix transcriptional regulator [Cupriavidus plantarum]|uniref:WYL domain-containing protein n=1 Tax=Cupriavidus plantarum TaxID=942865 RepID=A0A316F018_9BURK|nr:WYL domain-containing protein [Cupriavidus plantarum]PWK37662.1 WYL domain-containing protein [Cupriavidus plantarum]